MIKDLAELDVQLLVARAWPPFAIKRNAPYAKPPVKVEKAGKELLGGPRRLRK